MGNHFVKCPIYRKRSVIIVCSSAICILHVQYIQCSIQALCDNAFGKLDGALTPQMITTHGDARG